MSVSEFLFDQETSTGEGIELFSDGDNTSIIAHRVRLICALNFRGDLYDFTHDGSCESGSGSYQCIRSHWWDDSVRMVKGFKETMIDMLFRISVLLRPR